jgi:hypothetical protein
MLNEGIQIHNFISNSGSDFFTSYGSGSASTSQKVTVPQSRFSYSVYICWVVFRKEMEEDLLTGDLKIKSRNNTTMA